MKTQDKTLNLGVMKIDNILSNASIPIVSATDEDDNSSKYGVTEKKKAEIDALQFLVLDEQGEVKELQAIVNSLTQKQNKLNAQLNTAMADKERALSNKNLADGVKNDLDNLIEVSAVAIKKTVSSETTITRVATSVNELVNQLIYSAEVVNKLAILVNKKKQSNPLISGELVDKINQIGTDANNAITLTMKALKSVFASQTTTTEAESALTLELTGVAKLYYFVTGTDIMKMTIKSNSSDGENDSGDKNRTNIVDLLHQIYNASLKRYNVALKASQETTEQLAEAQDELSKAQASLASSQAALAAANAAALAS